MAGDDKKLDREMSETERSAREAGISEEPWIAVAPIKVLAGDAELSNLAEALTEGITSGLSRFSYLLVTSQSPVSTDTPVTKNVRYLLEGTLREAGSTVRFAFQLIDSSGARVWDATFDRDLGEISALEVQDDLTDRVVASVADPYGGLIRDLTSSIKLKTPEEMTAYEAVLRQIVYRQRIGESDHLLTRQALERAVELEPGNADAWAALALIINEEYKHDYNRLPETQARALAAARKALELEPGNAFANHALAEVYFFLQDVGAFRAAAERAISLNPRDSDSMAMIGIMMGYAGDWDRSVELTTRALELNPNHPGWYRFSLFFNAYRLGDYQKALDIAQRINMPEYFADSYARAIAHAQLGHEVAAQAALDEFLALWPGDMENFTSVHLERWFYAQPELVEQVMEGLRKAGLEESGQP
jgi:adenylate cyclase